MIFARLNQGLNFEFHYRVEKELFKSKNAKYSQVISKKDSEHVGMHQEFIAQGDDNHNNKQHERNQNKIDKDDRKMNLLKSHKSDESKKLLTR